MHRCTSINGTRFARQETDKYIRVPVLRNLRRKNIQFIIQPSGCRCNAAFRVKTVENYVTPRSGVARVVHGGGATGGGKKEKKNEQTELS